MPPRSLHLVLAPLACVVTPALAHAQTPPSQASGPDPARVVGDALGSERPLVRQSARQTAQAPRDWTVRLRTRQRDCYELLGFASGAARVTAEVHARAARQGEPVSLASGAGVARHRFCAELPGQVYSLVVHAEGPASWTLAVRAAPPEASAAATTSTPQTADAGTPSAATTASTAARADGGTSSAPRAPAYPVGGTESDFIANQIRAFAQAHPGVLPLIPAARGNLSTNQSREIPLPLSAGHCVDIVAAGVPSVSDLDLELADPGGQRVSQDQGHRAVESLHYCPAYSGTYHLTVRMFAGFGGTGVQAFESR